MWKLYHHGKTGREGKGDGKLQFSRTSMSRPHASKFRIDMVVVGVTKI